MSFQSRVRESLETLLREFGFPEEPEAVIPKQDPMYLRWLVTAGEATLEIYVYEDEAGYLLNGKWNHFERQGYLHDPAKLEVEFLSSVRARLVQSRADPPGA